MSSDFSFSPTSSQVQWSTSSAPSAPPVELEQPYSAETAESTLALVDWNHLPEVANPSTQESRIITIAKKALPGAKYTLGGAAVVAFFTITAAPVVVVGSVAALALASIGCHFAEKKIEQNDESFLEERKKQRLQIKNELKKGFGYTHIRKKYSNEIMTDHELNLIFTADIKNLPYTDFIKKHGREALMIFDERNKETLKKSFLESKNLTLKNLSSLETEIQHFNISREHLENFISTNEILSIVNDQLTYEQFIARNGTDILDKVRSNLFHYPVLQSKFQNYVISKELGWLDIKNQYSEHLKYLTLNSFYVLGAEIVKLEQAQMNYLTFRARNGFAAIAEYASTYPQAKVIIGCIFSKLPYEQLTSPKFKEDRQLLSFGANEIKGFLTVRWQEMSLKSILQEDPGFINCIGKEFQKEECRDKALEETKDMTIAEIGLNFPWMFQSGILSLETKRLKGQTFEECVQNELKCVQTLEDLGKAFPQVLFECNILHKNMPLIAKLVTTYITNNIRQVIGVNPNSSQNALQRFMENFHLIPDAILPAYQCAKADNISEQKRYDSLSDLIEKSFKEKSSDSKRIRDEKFHHVESEYRDQKALLENTKDQYDTSVATYNALELKVQQNKNKYNENNDSLQRESLKCAELESQAAIISIQLNDNGSISQDLQSQQSKLKSLLNQIETDASYSKLSKKIVDQENLKPILQRQQQQQEEIQALKKEAAAVQVEIDSLKAKVQSEEFINKKKELERSITEKKNAISQPITGVAAAVGALAKGYSGLSAEEKQLEKMLTEEKQLQEKSEQFQVKHDALKNKESNLLQSGQPADILLQNCQNTLSDLKNQRQNLETSLKQKLQIPSLEVDIKNLQHKEKLFNDCRAKHAAIKEEIFSLKQHQMELQRLNGKLIEEFHQIEHDIRMESTSKLSLYQQYNGVQKSTAIVKEKMNSEKAEAERQYTEAILTIEKDRQMAREALDKEHQQNVNAIIEKYEASVK